MERVLQRLVLPEREREEDGNPSRRRKICSAALAPTALLSPKPILPLDPLRSSRVPRMELL